ncbi:GtrA family protein [Sphingobium subterraneum]|uniref:Putative flippase GtrA n=1 Tax=Sphingobium subterraneum TaxID=627688 RepID=A0A841J9T6_9SPHN|nr:GtrA family protein [Sphingobium subterraneum]MBB6125265.1 putative flippase GtrA [Sphingobium subterraneum]
MFRRIDFFHYATLAGQVSRFAVSGLVASLINLAVYHAGVVLGGIDPNVAWTAGFIAASAIAFILHDRWSFRTPTARSQKIPMARRFAVVSLSSFALNSFWVWLMVRHFGMPVWSPYPLVIGLSPALAFWFNRTWVFR